MTFFLETNIYQFFGRFHALIVHLPIGFIILAVIFECLVWKKKIDLKLAISYALLIGASFGVIAVVLGLMLASDGGYNIDTLSLHKWTGIATTIVAFLLFFLSKKKDTVVWVKKIYPVIIALIMILLSVAGHYGGNLTHGSNYLFEHAPASIRAIAGIKPVRERVTNLDSALVYEDVIHVIFEKKCNVCHNNDKAKGDLLLVDSESILKGGENGKVVIAGDASKSELYRRITLDPHHKEFMPTEGRTPLTNEETLLIKWWIDEGVSFDKKVVELNLTDRIKDYLQDVGIGLKKSFIESLNLSEVDNKILDSIRAEGFKIKTVTNRSTLLEVNYPIYNKEPLNEGKLDVLLRAKENITWLNFSGIPIQENLISKIGQLENLTELRVNNSKLTNEAIKYLTQLKHLEYLNVYGNPISNASVESFQKLTKLKKLYLWKTNISEESMLKIKDSLPQVTIITGEQNLNKTDRF
ncbi:c-type cytochrome domain-containing protein [Flavivirga spongiicola]|uniref:Cytochrome C Planctomycete-type domain-containing protein n=1 Tax=Flavivirga spongiicola TaxID=421621 RepID=A0ABU7XS43_9FLAO|nr:c-type cytochrome domain-containing protein [Flavivirga sp. MEBiC05379]MDO5978390.1 c-type cytochrome domain-containing protein [Flavivirga sp. MEBiC05379]